jgi:hypothetical protein
MGSIYVLGDGEETSRVIYEWTVGRARHRGPEPYGSLGEHGWDFRGLLNFGRGFLAASQLAL